MDYRMLVVVGLILSFVLVLVSQKRALRFRYAVDEEEKADFSKPFRFRFWLIVMISSIVYLGVYSYLLFSVKALMKA
jgi:hypothetical protein